MFYAQAIGPHSGFKSRASGQKFYSVTINNWLPATITIAISNR